jgi:hypothetical protein
VTSSDDAGRYSLEGGTPGTLTVTLRAQGYLDVSRAVAVTEASESVLPDAGLLGGDADGTCSIDLYDLVLVSSSYGSAPPADVRPDIDANGVVDIYDLVLVSANFGQSCPGPWHPADQAVVPPGWDEAPVHR